LDNVPVTRIVEALAAVPGDQQVVAIGQRQDQSLLVGATVAHRLDDVGTVSLSIVGDIEAHPGMTNLDVVILSPDREASTGSGSRDTSCSAACSR